MDTSESGEDTPRKDKSKRQRSPSLERWKEELKQEEKEENGIYGTIY